MADDPTSWGAQAVAEPQQQTNDDPAKWGAVAQDDAKPSMLNTFVQGFKEGYGDEPPVRQQDFEWMQKNLPGAVQTSAYAVAGTLDAALRLPGAVYRGTQATLHDYFGLPGDIVSLPDAFAGSPHPTGMFRQATFGEMTKSIPAIKPIAEQFDKQVVTPAIQQTAFSEATKTAQAIDDEAQRTATGKTAGEGAPAASASAPSVGETLQEARNLHVVGLDAPENISLVDLANREEATPAEQAIQAVPPRSLSAAVTPEELRQAASPSEPIEQYEARFKQWIDKIDAPDDVRGLIESAARENDLFPQARDGEVPPSHVAAVAEAAGLDPADIDRQGLATRFDSDAKVRAVVQALRHTTNDVKVAAKKMNAEPSEENAAALTETQERHRYVTEYTLGMRAESGRTLNAWKDLLREQERGTAVREITKGETEGKLPTGVADVVDATHEVRANLASGADGKVGLQKLVDAAERLANAPPAAGKDGVPAPPLTPELKGMIQAAKDALARLKGDAEPASPEEAKSNLQKLVESAERQVDNARKQNPTGRAPTNALPPEWQALVDKADLVTKRFGGVAKGEEAAFMLAKSGRTMAEQAELARSVEGLTPTQVAKVLDRLRKNQGTPWYYAIPQQAFLTGIGTHVLYFGVNMANLVYRRMLQPFAASLFDKVLPGRTEMSSLAAFRAAPELISAIPDAARRAIQAFKTGERVLSVNEERLVARGEKTPGEKSVTTPYTHNRVDFGVWNKIASSSTLGSAEKIITSPGRAANTIHTFFRMLGERASAGQTAYTLATKDVKYSEIGSDTFWARYEHHLANPTDDALMKAAEDGYTGTYMEEMGPAMQKLSSFVKDTPVKWLVFFMHIPFNIVKQGSELALGPLAPFAGTRMGKAIRGELGKSEQSLALSATAVGMSMSAYFLHKGMTGEMTGGYPADPKEQARWKLLNLQPYSVKIGNTWVQLDRFGSLAFPAKLAGDYAYIFNHHDFTDPAGAAKGSMALILATGHMMLTDSGFDGVLNLVDAMEGKKDPGDALAWQTSGYAQPLSFLSQTASEFDPYMREASTFVNAFKNRVPGLRSDLLPKRDPLYGEPIPNPGYHSFVRTAPQNTDPVKQEMDRLQYYPGAPQKSIGGVKLTPEQYDRYEATAGPLAKQALTATIRSPEYQNAPDVQKRGMLKGYLEWARDRAKSAMQAENPQITRDAVNLAYTKAGLTPP